MFSNYVMIIFNNHMFKVGTSKIHQNIDKNHNLQSNLQTTSKSFTNGPHQCKIIMFLNVFISHFVVHYMVSLKKNTNL
jgi:hypothetical protein